LRLNADGTLDPDQFFEAVDRRQSASSSSSVRLVKKGRRSLTNPDTWSSEDEFVDESDIYEDESYVAFLSELGKNDLDDMNGNASQNEDELGLENTQCPPGDRGVVETSKLLNIGTPARDRALVEKRYSSSNLHRISKNQNTSLNSEGRQDSIFINAPQNGLQTPSRVPLGNAQVNSMNIEESPRQSRNDSSSLLETEGATENLIMAPPELTKKPLSSPGNRGASGSPTSVNHQFNDKVEHPCSVDSEACANQRSSDSTEDEENETEATDPVTNFAAPLEESIFSVGIFYNFIHLADLVGKFKTFFRLN
jgi:hypothetical protein